METRIVGRGIVYHEEKVLIVQQRLTGVWTVPGGGWEGECETIAQCVERECQEETGLQVEVIAPLYFDEYQKNEKNFVVLYYFAKLRNGSQEISLGTTDEAQEDVADAKWVSREEVQSMDTVWPKELKDNKFWDNDLPHLLSIEN